MQFRMATGGTSRMGSLRAGHGIAHNVTIYYPPAIDWKNEYHGAIGACTYRSLIYREPYSFYRRKKSAIAPGFSGRTMVATFYTKNGVPLGRVFSNGADSIQMSAAGSSQYGSDRTAKLTLRNKLNFPILPVMIIQLDSGYGFRLFTGETQIGKNPIGLSTDQLEFSLLGLENQVKRIPAPATILGARDAGAIVYDLALNNICQPFSSIKLNASKITTTTGQYVAFNIAGAKKDLAKILDLLASVSGCRWGVDRVGEFFFRPIPTAVTRVLWEGRNTGELKVSWYPDKIVNDVTVQREQQSGTSLNGTIIGGLASDPTSAANYGAYHLDATMPWYAETALCDTYATRLLQPEPPVGVEIDQITIDDLNTFPEWSGGLFRLKKDFLEVSQIVQQCENAADWTKAGIGDLAVTASTVQHIEGAKSILLSYTNALGDIITAPLSSDHVFRKMRLNLYSGKTGKILRFGVGRYSWTEYTIDLEIPVAGSWIWMELPTVGLNKLGYVGFEILDSAGVANTIYIDRVEAVSYTQEAYDLELSRVDWSMDPTTGLVAGLSFGEPDTNKLENKIKAIEQIAKDAKSAAVVK